MSKNTITLLSIIFATGLILFAILGGQKNTEVANKNKNNTITTPPVINERYPAFKFVDVDGKKITNKSFRKKPVLIWFTTAWCVPCQIGAKKVRVLDEELGGSAFDVMVVFVDKKETASDLRKWRENFGSSDWIITFDDFSDPFSKKIELKYLDSKYLLDKKGVLKNIDFKIADQTYLNLIKSLVDKN